MPNHCSNYLEVKVAKGHEDFFNKMVVAINDGKLNAFIIPIPECLEGVIAGSYGAGTPEQDELERRYASNIEECGYPNGYEFCFDQWGTKWDLYEFDLDTDEENRIIRLYFNSAWCPPIGVYARMDEMDEIESFHAVYFEPGCAFCGFYGDGVDTEYSIDEFTQEWVDKNIPNYVCETMGMYEYMAECEEYEE